MVHEKIAAMISETIQRVPMTDFFETKFPKQCSVQHRSVVGGFYINMLLGNKNFNA